MKEINNKELFLGKHGENGAVTITFDLADWKNKFGEGSLRLLHRRRPDREPYEVPLKIDGDTATWTVSYKDTAHSGNGQAELVYVAGDRLVKSSTIVTVVAASLGGEISIPVDPSDDEIVSSPAIS